MSPKFSYAFFRIRHPFLTKCLLRMRKSKKSNLIRIFLWRTKISDSVCNDLKGIVHPKMKILSSFTHPQVVPNLYECLCSAEHKGRYSEERGKQSSSGAPLTSTVLFPTMEVNGAPKQPGYKLLQNIFLVFGRTKKFIQVWNYLRVSKWWQHFHFWVNYPFKYFFI